MALRVMRDARRLYRARSFGWLDAHLRPGVVGQAPAA